MFNLTSNISDKRRNDDYEFFQGEHDNKQLKCKKNAKLDVFNYGGGITGAGVCASKRAAAVWRLL